MNKRPESLDTTRPSHSQFFLIKLEKLPQLGQEIKSTHDHAQLVMAMRDRRKEFIDWANSLEETGESSLIIAMKSQEFWQILREESNAIIKKIQNYEARITDLHTRETSINLMQENFMHDEDSASKLSSAQNEIANDALRHKQAIEPLWRIKRLNDIQQNWITEFKNTHDKLADFPQLTITDETIELGEKPKRPHPPKNPPNETLVKSTIRADRLAQSSPDTIQQKIKEVIAKPLESITRQARKETDKTERDRLHQHRMNLVRNDIQAKARLLEAQPKEIVLEHYHTLVEKPLEAAKRKLEMERALWKGDNISFASSHALLITHLNRLEQSEKKIKQRLHIVEAPHAATAIENLEKLERTERTAPPKLQRDVPQPKRPAEPGMISRIFNAGAALLEDTASLVKDILKTPRRTAAAAILAMAAMGDSTPNLSNDFNRPETGSTVQKIEMHGDFTREEAIKILNQPEKKI